MIRFSFFFVISVILFTSGSSVAVAAGNWDGRWIATIQAEGMDVEACQFTEMRVNFTISDGKFRLRARQQEESRVFRGSIDRAGNLQAFGDWTIMSTRNMTKLMKLHGLKAKFERGSFVGAFYTAADESLGQDLCFASLTISRNTITSAQAYGVTTERSELLSPSATSAGTSVAAENGGGSLRDSTESQPNRTAAVAGKTVERTEQAPTVVAVDREGDSSGTSAAGNSNYDGNWTATLRADGSDAVACQFSELRGNVAISGDKIRLTFRQGGNNHEFRGKVDSDGKFQAAGDWGNGTSYGYRLQMYYFKGKIEDGRFVGTFFDVSDNAAGLEGSGGGCFANFIIVRSGSPSPAVASADASPVTNAAGSPQGSPDTPATEATSVAEEMVATTEQTTAQALTDASDGEGDGSGATGAAGSPQGSSDARATRTTPVAAPTATTTERTVERTPTGVVAREGDGSAATGDPGDPEGRMETARRIVAERPITEAVAYVNGPGDLSLTEQWTLFSGLEGPEIVKRLKASDDTTARKIARALETVANGTEVSQPQMKAELSALGIGGGTALTYLALFERARKHARTVRYGAALAELRRTPQVANIAVRAPAERSPAVTGKARKVALLIGVESYRDPIPDLKTPAADVEAIGRLLHQKLGYETRILRNATRENIVTALQDLVDTLGEEDSVVIMYAGHGYILEATGVGYWLPEDATTNTAKQWISNKDIATFLKAIRAKRIMLIADSCYSGSLLSGDNEFERIRLGLSGEEIADKRSVVIMTSGGEEPVRDDGGKGHSVFARQLITALDAIDGNRQGARVHRGVKTRIAQLAPQVPRYGGVAAAGHQAGTDYIFRFAASPVPVAGTTDNPSAMNRVRVPAIAATVLVFIAVGGVALRRRSAGKGNTESPDS